MSKKLPFEEYKRPEMMNDIRTVFGEGETFEEYRYNNLADDIRSVFGEAATNIKENKYNANLGSFDYNLNLLGTNIEDLEKIGYKIIAILPTAPREMQIHVKRLKPAET